MYSEEKYPLLPYLAYAARWMDGFTSLIEGLVLSISGLMLNVGLIMGTFDFISGGNALRDPIAFNTWAFIQTFAIDSQFISMWYRSKLAFREKKFITALGYTLLGSLLGFVTFGANAIPSLQSALHIDFTSALNQLGLNAVTLVYARASVSIVLAIIAAYNRTVLQFDESGSLQKDGQKNVTKIEAAQAKKQQKLDAKKSKKARGKFIQFPRIFGKKNAPQIAEKQEQKIDDPQAKIEQENMQSAEQLSTQKDEQKSTEEDGISIAEIPLRNAENLSVMTRKLDEEELTEERGLTEKTANSVMTENRETTQAEERDTDPDLTAIKNDTNPSIESAEPLEPESSADDEGPDTGDLTEEKDKDAESGSASQFTSSAPRGSSPVRVESRGYTKEELYSHPRILAALKGKRATTIKNTVDKAWESGAIKKKTDGKARENAVTTWVKTLA